MKLRAARARFALLARFARFALLALLALASCASVPRPPPERPGWRSHPCEHTQLEAEPPTPIEPIVTGFLWLDPQTLVAAIGGASFRRDGQDFLDIDPDSDGLLVIDVPHRKVIRSYRGAGFTQAVVAPGSQTELIFTDGAYQANGWQNRFGTLDLATGCLDASAWMAPMAAVIDPITHGWIVGRSADANRGYETLERWDTPARAAVIRQVSRFDSIAYDPTTRSLVTSGYGDDTIRTRDPRTLADRARTTLDVHVWHGFALRPGRGQLLMTYETRCTNLNPRTSMAVRCREGPRRSGVIVMDIDPLAVVRRHPTANEDHATWSPDGAAVIAPCESQRAMCEWSPETDQERVRPGVPLDHRVRRTFAPDGVTYATAGSSQTIEVRSHATDALLAQIPLPRGRE